MKSALNACDWRNQPVKVGSLGSGLEMRIFEPDHHEQEQSDATHRLAVTTIQDQTPT